MNNTVYHVFWTQTARQDLKRIIDYIAADSEDQAKRTYQAIRQKAADLKSMPPRGRIVPELRCFSILTYRELISSPWRIVYKLENDRVFVLAVIDGRRNFEDILLDRFI